MCTYLYAFHDCHRVVGLRPLLLEDVEADLSVRVDIRVEHLRVHKRDLRGLRWVFLGKLQLQVENAALPVCVVRAQEYALPFRDFTFVRAKQDV